jgi:hypothetical protein
VDGLASVREMGRLRDAETRSRINDKIVKRGVKRKA